MEQTPKRPASEQPTQFGSATAVSNSGENQRLGETSIPPSHSDQTVLIDSGRTLVPGAATRAEWSGGPGDTNPVLQPGTVVANRYEILNLLGKGGMGSVYKAQDRELDRLVALKVIRPEMARDPMIVERFKQELRLSHKVTHRNVVRMYDLAEDGGMRFVTMELVAGRDLHSELEERGKLPPDEAVDILGQICLALEATHGVGILHRDLKPQNVMREANGRVVVMDFGMARAIDGNDGMTQTGALVGTLDYMSPEQALGKKLDQRSDIFTLGLIGYELLTGAMPFRAESAIASLLNRTQQRAAPLVEVDKTIPGTLSNIIAKCLEKDPANRYQNAAELAADLPAWKGKIGGKKVSASSARLRMIRIRELPWPRLAAIGVLVLAVAVGSAWFAMRRQQTAKSGTQVPVSVLVADFANHTGDPLLDNTLEPMVGLALEGASFVNVYSRVDARRLAEKLPKPTDKLDEQSARLVAVGQGVHAVITGDVSLRGDEYDLSAMALDAVSGKVLARSEVSVANKQEILGSIPKLTVPIRNALGDSTPASVQFEEVSGGFKAASLEAVHQASLAVDQQLAGKFQEAFNSFQKAAEMDPKLTWAYTGMAAMEQNLGHSEDALKYMKLAMEQVDNMTDRERYRDRGLYYLTAGEWQNCVQETTQLVTRYPADRVGQNNLATCYTQLRSAPKALEAARHAVEIVPNGVGPRLNLAFIESFAGDFAASEKDAQAGKSINPNSTLATLVLAESRLGQGQLDKAAEAYHQLEGMGASAAAKADSASTASAGLADLAAYQGKYAEAAEILTDGASADLANKNTDGAARKYAALANLEELKGNHAAALADLGKALGNSQATAIEFLAARTYADAGEFAKAQKLATILSSARTGESQAYGKIVAGLIALKKKDANGAIRQIAAANNLLDTWIGRFDLGQAYLAAGAFTEADSEFDQCAKRRGEAIELFMDNVPTYAYFPPVYYDQGRVREGMKSAGFADFYKTYLSIRGQSTEDPLAADARRRMGN
jgi:eukaryotic-like serine/threonine-protein kinase